MKCQRAMELVEALGAAAGEVISLVGGGGKTTLMYRLVEALTVRGLRAAAATTTKISPPTLADPCTLVLADSYTALRRSLDAAPSPVVLGRSRLSATKVAGVPPEWCDQLLADGVLDCLVVEADGAARKPLKAPAAWEPVVPAATHRFVAVVGLSCLGAPLDAEHVFRPERVAAASGLALGAPVTAAAIGRLLLAPQGLATGCPAGAHAVALLNQADSAGAAAAAQEIAAAVLGGGDRYERVLSAALGREHSVREVWCR